MSELNAREVEAGLPPTANYRYAERVAAELIVAGQVPQDAQGRLVGVGDAGIQVRQCLDNLERLVRTHELGIDAVRHLTIHVVGDQPRLASTWETVTAWFGGEVPPATLLGAASLGYADQLVEVDARIIAN